MTVIRPGTTRSPAGREALTSRKFRWPPPADEVCRPPDRSCEGAGRVTAARSEP
jgi:hypothetical protein